ncbi:MAG: helix-turn-helix domain-containing protein [Velocimicrobium sp.]
MLHEKLLKVIDDNQKMEIAKRITASRESAQISSQEMADFVGLSYEQYRRIERGALLVKTEHINAIVQALDVTADYILYGDTSQMKHESISEILNGLSKEELERAERILLAAFK